jgi:hypothetical protein
MGTIMSHLSSWLLGYSQWRLSLGLSDFFRQNLVMVLMLKRIVDKISSLRSGHAALFSISPRAAGQKLIICYSTGRWSLGFVWRGVSSSKAFSEAANSPKAVICDSIGDLKKTFSASDAYVFVMSGSRIAEVLRAGIPPQRVIFYSPHVELNKAVPRVKELHAILAQSLFEYNLYLAKGVDFARVFHFPAGVDRAAFFPSTLVSDSNCEIDVLFVGSGYSARQVGERYRKGYSLQVELIPRLVESGFKVAVIGPGWEDDVSSMPVQVQLLNPPYSDYPSLMRSSRLLCSVAVQEGGPLSFPEALACGCSTLTMMTGLSLGFESGCEGVWHMPMAASADEWLAKIRSILSQERPPAWPKAGAREKFLKMADYEQLGRQLVSICFPSA